MGRDQDAHGIEICCAFRGEGLVEIAEWGHGHVEGKLQDTYFADAEFLFSSPIPASKCSLFVEILPCLKFN